MNKLAKFFRIAVELSVLGDTVKKIGRFLPVYWYEDLNDMLSTYSELSKSQLNKVYEKTRWKQAITCERVGCLTTRNSWCCSP